MVMSINTSETMDNYENHSGDYETQVVSRNKSIVRPSGFQKPLGFRKPSHWKAQWFPETLIGTPNVVIQINPNGTPINPHVY